MEDLKSIVHKVIGQMSSNSGGDGHRIEEVWPAVVGERAAAHTRVAGLQKRTLVVYVDSPAWLYQMNLKRLKTLQQVKDKVGTVDKIYFKIGKING